MGRHLNPLVRQELENLGKDPDSRKSAMKALRTYVQGLDTRDIPLFLAHVSKTKEPELSSGEYTISLYEVLARFHGRSIVPQIDNIMSTIVKTLSSSPGSYHLHVACSKVVPAIARYGIDPMTSDVEKTRIISSLCKPLSDILMGFQQGAASGAALCLKALVESENWRFASDEMVNELCLKAAGALQEKMTQTSSHMSLVNALSENNSLTIEAYASMIIQSGIQILTGDFKESNSQKRLSAVQMIHFLIKSVDSRSISSMLPSVIDVMEKCKGNPMRYVGEAAAYTLQTAKIVAARKESRQERSPSLMVGSMLRTTDKIGPLVSSHNPNAKHNGLAPESRTPESQTLSSYADFEMVSPTSIGQNSSNFRYARHASRRLRNNNNACVDALCRCMSDSLSSRADNSGVGLEEHGQDERSEMHEEQSVNFCRFTELKETSGVNPNKTPSPQRSTPQLTIDDVKIFTTPRKLVFSLQDQPTDNCVVENRGMHVHPALSWRKKNEEVIRRGNFDMQHLSNDTWGRKLDGIGMVTIKERRKVQNEPVSCSTESILSTCQAPASCVCTTFSEVECSGKSSDRKTESRTYAKTATRLLYAFLLLLFAVLLSATCNYKDASNAFVPT